MECHTAGSQNSRYKIQHPRPYQAGRATEPFEAGYRNCRGARQARTHRYTEG